MVDYPIFPVAKDQVVIMITAPPVTRIIDKVQMLSEVELGDRLCWGGLAGEF